MELVDQIIGGEEAPACEELAAWGFREPAGAYDNLRRLLAQATPPEFGALFDVLAAILPGNPDPDRALNNLERFSRVAQGMSHPIGIARERPMILELLVRIFGTSQFFADVLIRYPHYLDWLSDFETFAEPTDSEALDRDLRAALRSVEGAGKRRSATVRWLRRQLLRAGAREIVAELGDAKAESDEEHLARVLDHEAKFMRELSRIAIAALSIACEECRARLELRFGEPIEEDVLGEGSSRAARFAIVAMGKLGGMELNFSSDVDLIYLYSAEGQTTGVSPGGAVAGGGPPQGRISNHDFFCRLGEKIGVFVSEMTGDGYLYRVDTRLRPDGREGPLARSIDAFEFYHETQARPWERLALVKALAVAGDAEFCERVDRLTQALVYDRPVGPEIVEQVRKLKVMIDRSVEQGEDAGREIKRGHGGIREIEFLVQTLQLLNARREPELRARSTLGALAALASSGMMETAIAEQHRRDYLILRRIENRLQMLDLRQTHTLPEDPERLEALARRCGIFERGAGAATSPGANLAEAWADISARVRSRFVEFFGDGRGDGGGDGDLGEDGESGTETSGERIARLLLAEAPESELIPLLMPYGLNEAGSIKTLARLGGMGRATYLGERGRELYEQILPSLLAAAGRSARPASAVGHLESFAIKSGTLESMFEIFAANPRLLEFLLCAFGAGDLFAKTLIAHPEYADQVFDTELMVAAFEPEEIIGRIGQWCRWTSESGEERDSASFAAGLARVRRFTSLMVGLADLGDFISFGEATRSLSTMADLGVEATLRYAVGRTQFDPADANPVPGFAVLAMGKLGTRELNYYSDLDIIFCRDNGPDDLADGAADSSPPVTDAEATRVAETISQILTSTTPDGAAFALDARLRPEGASAPLVASFSRFIDYYSQRAEPWEFQSFTRIRHIAGDAALSERLIGSLRKIIAARLGEKDSEQAIAAPMRAMRARIEAAVKTPKWVLCDYKKGPGGVIDLEFIAQYFQLKRLGDGLDLIAMSADLVFAKMAEAGELDAETATVMQTDYRFLRRFEARARLLFETERSHAPNGGEKWDNLCRATADLIPDGADAREHLLTTLARNRRSFEAILGSS